MPNLEDTIADLARRVARLEDELAIQRLIASYGLAVDTGDADGSAAVFTERGVYDTDVGRMAGREAVRAMVRGARHQEMVGHCAHQIGPAVIRFDEAGGATAVGYSRVYLETRAGTHVYRVSLNRWELVKEDGRWLIARRVTRKLGTDGALDVIR
jgi:uncharacterized protein (TIGR02246 family)